MPSITIPFGPQHPALKEPINFQFDVEGEEITGARVRTGYNHRGIEKALESRNFYQGLYLVERVCGICSHSHTTCYVQAIEEILKCEVPKRGLYLRTLVCELERIHSHLLWLGVAGHEVGFDSLFMYVWRDREIVMRMLEEISGNRVNYAINTYGGVRRNITEDQKQRILEMLKVLRTRIDYYLRIGANEPTFVARIKGVGKMSRDRAVAMCTSGPFARASGVDSDVRRDDPHAAYPELEFRVCTSDLCDILGRVIVRVEELVESCKMIEQILKNLPDGEIAVKVPRKIIAGEAVSRYEAPRGEDIHFLRTNGTDKPERYKIRAPTLSNIEAAAQSIVGGFVADIPICIAAIDPCFSCTDRAAVILNEKNRGTSIKSWEELRLYGIEWYRSKKGILWK